MAAKGLKVGWFHFCAKIVDLCQKLFGVKKSSGFLFTSWLSSLFRQRICDVFCFVTPVFLSPSVKNIVFWLYSVSPPLSLFFVAPLLQIVMLYNTLLRKNNARAAGVIKHIFPKSVGVKTE